MLELKQTLWSQAVWVRTPALLLFSCVTVSKLHNNLITSVGPNCLDCKTGLKIVSPHGIGVGTQRLNIMLEEHVANSKCAVCLRLLVQWGRQKINCKQINEIIADHGWCFEGNSCGGGLCGVVRGPLCRGDCFRVTLRGEGEPEQGKCFPGRATSK